MENARPVETSDTPSSPANSESVAINPLKLIRLLRSASGALFAQAALYGELAQVEWAEEKNRLRNMLLLTLLGFACLLCALLFAGVLLLVLSWDTGYRIPALLSLIALYALGLGIAWRRFQALSALSSQCFAATREELAADMALIKSKL